MYEAQYYYLKNVRKFGKDCFDDLVEKITEIRASERRFYQKIAESIGSVVMIITKTLKPYN